MSLKKEYESILQLADDTYATLGGAVAAVDVQQEVAAVGRGRSRGRGRFRGRARGGGSRGATQGARQNDQGSQGGRANDPADRHADGPPENSCRLHWRYGRGAYWCLEPERCPWAQQTTPKPRT